MSEPRTPTTILDLQRRVEALPARRQAAERLATIQHLRNTALNAAAQQQRAAEAIVCTVQTFEAAKVKEAQAGVAKAARMATRIMKLVADIESVDKKDVDAAFQDLQSGAAKAVSTIEQEWTRQINSVTTCYQRIVAVAERTGLSGSKRLSETLARIEVITKPRSQAVTSLSACLCELRETVQTLGLEGEGGRFLTRIADGNADAKDLTRPEIAEYLTEHKLWPLLVVRFAQ